MKQRKQIETQSAWVYVAIKFLVAYLMLLITQIGFAWHNHGLFTIEDSHEVWGIILGNLHFGLSGTAMVLWPMVLMMALPFDFRYKRGYQVAERWVSGVGVGLMLCANIADSAYYQWVLRRTAADVFSYALKNFGGQGSLMGHFVTDFWPYYLTFFVMFGVWIWISRRIRLVPNTNAERRIIHKAISCLLMVFLVLTAVRGGWIKQHKPLSPIDTSRYCKASNSSLVINTPFSIIRTLGNVSHLSRLEYFDDDKVDKIFNPVCLPDGKNDEQKLNIVLVILEGFSEEYMGAINQTGETYTPFLDQLAQKSMVFKGRSNGKRSIESLPSLYLGIPCLMDEAYITSSYSLNKTLSLPQILKSHGYATAFYHGAHNGSMNFDGFTHGIGIDRYVGQNEYPDQSDYDGNWGIFDEPFLKFVATDISQLKEPFFSSIYTISSHHPYTIPEQHKGRFKKGEIPLLETIGYSDYAMKCFFEEAQKQPWFDNTIFIITADHPAQPLSAYYREYAYNVPMMIYSPMHIEPKRVDKLFQHTDLMPTVISMLGLKDTCLSFGHNAMEDGKGFHIAYPGNYYILETSDHLVFFNGEKITSGNATKQEENMVKAIVQQFNNRMIDNRLMP